MTPKERELAKALANKNQTTAPATQPLPGRAPPPSTTPGGGGGVAKVGISAKDNENVSGLVARRALAGATLGASELLPGDLGGKAEKAGRGAFTAVNDFLKKLDPTNTGIKRADTGRLDAAQQGVTAAGATAGGMAKTIAANPITAERVTAPNTGPAAQVERQGSIVADTVRGSTPVVQAGQAQAGSMEAARIVDVERMVSAGLSRDDAELRARQTSLADALAASAAGEGPSLAQAQLQRANEQAVANQMALAASARGGNPILAQRQAAQNVAALQQENAGKSAELRLAEAIQARGQLGQVLDSARGQDIAVAGTQAGLDQEAARVNSAAANARSTAQAGFEQDASKTNALEAGQTSRFNVETGLRADMANQDVDLRAALADQGASLTAQTATASNNLTADTFNAKAQDEMARFQADAGLRANIADTANKLQAQGMTVDAVAKMLGLEIDSLKSVLASEGEVLKTEQARLTAEKENAKGMAGGIIGSVGQVIAMCFPAGEQVLMSDGSQKNIEDVQLGEEAAGGTVVGLRTYLSNESLYRVGNATMTGSHAVSVYGRWRRAADVGELVEGPAPRQVYSLVTTTSTMMVGGVLVGDDTVAASDLHRRSA